MNKRLKTVLIFAHECAPYHRPESTAGAQRPAQFAKHLPEFGWRAIVLCCDSRTRGRCQREDLREVGKRVREEVRRADSNASVVIPTPSLPWDGFLDRCWRLTLPGDRGASRAKSLFRKPLTAAKFLTGDYSQAWQPVARIAAEALANEQAVDACIGEHSPDAGLFLARWFCSKYGVPWAADFRDPILQPLTGVARLVYAPRARRLVATAALTINVNPVWATLDGALFGRPAWSIPNGFDPTEFTGSNGTPKNGRFRITYAGGIKRVQQLGVFVAGLALMRQLIGEEAFRDVVFVYRGAAGGQVVSLFAAAGMSEVVDVGPHVTRKHALAELRRADMLLLLSVAHPEQQDVYYGNGFYPAKAFEYFGARKPILCVPGDGGLLDELIRETRTGQILRTPRDVADYLIGTWSQWKTGAPIPYEPDEQAVSQYTRRTLTRRLAMVLHSVTGTMPPGYEERYDTRNAIACPSRC